MPGYHIIVGGGSGAEAKLGREFCHSVPAEELPQRVEAMLRDYLEQRRPGESFHDFTGRHSIEELRGLFRAAGTVEA